MEKPLGVHGILDLYDCSPRHLNDVAFILSSLEQAVRVSLSTLLKIVSHEFSPQGVTALALMAESHLSIHTWPEHRYVAVDIFTCGTTALPCQAATFLAAAFEAQRSSWRVLNRGMDEGAVPH